MPLGDHLLNITVLFLRIIKLQTIILHVTRRLCVDVGWFAVTATMGFFKIGPFCFRNSHTAVAKHLPARGKYLHVLE